MSSINYDLKKIKAFVFDLDGVLSGNVVSVDSNGDPLRTINMKDSYAIQLAIKKGYHVAIITGGYTEALALTFSRIGVSSIYMRSAVKINDFNDFILKAKLKPEEVLYAGDDIPDYKVMELVGLPVAPADAVPEIKRIATYISARKGGEGVARDVIEQTMRAQGLWLCDEAFIW